MKRVTIILGAGAAKAWDALLTQELTQLILDDPTFTTKSNQPLGQYIFESLTQFHHGNSTGINFETIINSLETIQNYYMDKTVLGGSPIFVSSTSVWFTQTSLVDEMMNCEFLEKGQDQEHKTMINLATGQHYSFVPSTRLEAAYIHEVVKHFLNLIRSKIANYSYNIEDTKFEKLNSNLKEFLSYLKESGYVPRIYTSNYDRLLPSLLNKSEMTVFDGFNITSEMSDYGISYTADLLKILNDRNCLNYYCLHGSIFWDYDTPYNDVTYQYLCTPNNAHTDNFYNNADYTNPAENTFIYNIVTGYRKIQRISLEPLNSFHSVFTQDCINADLIITVGYSFSDFHINRPIKNAFKNKNPKLIHITFSANGIGGINELGYLKMDILRFKNNFNSDKIENDHWLFSENRSQMIYFNGFREFLENREWLKANI